MRSCLLDIPEATPRLLVKTRRIFNRHTYSTSTRHGPHREVENTPDSFDRLQGRSRSVFAVPNLSTSSAPSQNEATKPPEHRSRLVARSLDEWIQHIEHFLPPKLRSEGFSEVEHGTRNASPLLAALTLSTARGFGHHDILVELRRRGRWRAVMWLIKYLIEGLWTTASLKQQQQSVPKNVFGSSVKFEKLLGRPIESPALSFPAVERRASKPLDEVLGPEYPLQRTYYGIDVPFPGHGPTNVRSHRVLGHIWQSLGHMIIDDAAVNDGALPAGILEIIAIMHRNGVMPDVSYQYEASRGGLPGTQPPTLSLLSSQIMTTLSDAEWKARQAAAVESARSSGDDTLSYGPELPGSSYNVRVSGIRHDIWLELVLWACLHGGWIKHGVAIVNRVVQQQDPAWSILSWRETISPTIKPGDEASTDWSEIQYMIMRSTQGNSFTSDELDKPRTRSISSEVLAAYVEAIVNDVSVGVGKRGSSIEDMITPLLNIKGFLSKHNFGLESTSWDAVIQRILETEGINVESAPGLSEKLLALSAVWGEENAALNVPTRDEAWRPVSPYATDGSALTLGLSHRTLKAYIQRGDISGALRVFTELQNITDSNKRMAIAAFFRRLKEADSVGTEPEDAPASGISFTDRNAEIVYPAMFPSIPPQILSPFLDLITEVGATKFGKWFIASQDIDGPVVNPLAYKNRAMAPALIRFLTHTKDGTVLNKVLKTFRTNPSEKRIPHEVFLAILESQLQFNNPKAAVSTFLAMTKQLKLPAQTREILVALIAREVVRNRQPDPLLRDTLVQILKSPNSFGLQSKHIFNVVAILMAVSDPMKDFCRSHTSLPSRINLVPHIRTFNLILEGCVARYGSVEGCKLVRNFSEAARSAMSETFDISTSSDPGVALTLGSRLSPTEATIFKSQFRFTLDKARLAKKPSTQLLPVEVYGNFRPNISTIRIVLVKRLQEIQAEGGDEYNNDGTGNNEMEWREASREYLNVDPIVGWARRMFRALGMRDADVEKETSGRLVEDP